MADLANPQGFHLIIGAGVLGRSAAEALQRNGHDVVVATRSGSKLDDSSIDTVAVDATDASALAVVAKGARTIINAANPTKYTEWERDWPPLAASLLQTAETVGAGLVTMSNLYGYGRVDAPMTPQTPLSPNGAKGRVRAQMWREALAAHEAGRVNVTEVRASDYFGPGAGASPSLLNTYVIEPASKGSTVRLIVGEPDAKHSWAYIDDIGLHLATMATDDRAWGKAWITPTAPPLSFTEVVRDVARVTDGEPVKVTKLPRMLKKLARLAPVVRELDETAHQFERPFLSDASATTETFGLKATPWDQALAATIESLQSVK